LIKNGIIRKPKPGDLGWVISMHGITYSKEFQFDSNFELNIASKIIAFFDKAAAFERLWIKEIQGERAGSIAVSQISDQVAFINFLLVLSQFRGQGIAEELLDTAIHHAKEHKFSVIRLETYSCLKNARKLYKKVGFNMAKTTKDIEKFGQSFDQEFWELQL
jgi:ribosomal protein S18 acetylase RimI-like enzyme